MFKNIALALATVSIAFGAASGASFAGKVDKSKMKRFQVFDANSGDEIFNDGKMDGKACAIGTEVKFNPVTGKFKKVPSLKCNF